MKLMMVASVKNCIAISRLVAPSALRTPISRVRSVTDTSMMFITPMPPRKSVISATHPKKTVITLKIRCVSLAPRMVSQIMSASSSSSSK